MPKKTKEERIRAVFESASRVGIKERYAHVLSNVAVRRRLDRRVNTLLTRFERDYRTLAELNSEMWNDPAMFYRKMLGDKNFRRYATLSMTYSDASPIQMILRLLKDAKFTREYDSSARRAGILDADDSILSDHNLFWELRAHEKERAFFADVKANKIDQMYVQAIFDKIRYQKLPDSGCGDGFTDDIFNKVSAIRSLYNFFRSNLGRHFKKKIIATRTDDEKAALKEEIASAFFEAYRNDITINENLPEFPSKAYSANGTPVYVTGYDSGYRPISTRRSE
ncbi:MAG: hypothetical protein HY514_04740 [Candidatus Aenigmarchaeota archaeon]|nr:hypothetical protein [Candidatus Aenigmarchaeota archaeon]